MKAVSPIQILFSLCCYIPSIGLQTNAYSQMVQRQMISAQGGVYMANGFLFSQSIGQLSIIGTSTTSKLTFQQGFQQSLTSIVSNTISVPDFSVTLFPNPVVDSFTITVANAPEEPLTIKITNLLGQQLYQGQLPSFQSQKTIPFGSYPNGNYLVQLFSGNQIVTKKIIKI
jgi:hypothetical protein